MTTSHPPAASRRYMLRRTLFPWKFQETIDEVVRFAAEFGVDEVIWKIDTEEFSHGLPTLDLIRTYIPWLEQSREALAKVGVSMAINPWVTQGMRDAGMNLRSVHPDFVWMTDVSGVQANTIACPLGPAWRDWLRDAYLLYAGTGPRVLWLEDDMRVHGHRPVRWGCFCDLHLRRFAERIGRTITREQLAEEVLRPGEPTELRRQWMDFTGEGIVGAVRHVADAVYARHPEVQLGIMTSAPWAHAMECRDWPGIGKAVQGHHQALTVRPCMGNYNETSPRGIYDSRQLVSGTLDAIHQPVHACTEVENVPFTRFSKSLRFTRAQMLLSAALRCPSITLNLYDHIGTPLYEEPEYGQLLKATRPRLDALVQAYGPDGVEQGVRILCPHDGGKHKRLQAGANYGDLSMGRSAWADPLQAMGFACTFGQSAVTACCGQKLQAMTGELDALFAGGVLLDLAAVESLIEIGRQDLLGAELVETFIRSARATPAEQSTDAAFGDPNVFMPVDHLGLTARVARYRPRGNARVISQLVDQDRKPVQPGFVISRTPQGGRVALTPYEIPAHGLPTWFLNWHRQRQMLDILRWLSGDRLPLVVTGGAYGVPLRTDYADRVMLSLLNLSQDDWPNVTFEMFAPNAGNRAEWLDNQGRWHTLSAGDITRRADHLIITVRQSVAPLDLLTVRVAR